VCPEDILKLRAAAPQLAVIRAKDYILGALSKELQETIYEMDIANEYGPIITRCGNRLAEELRCHKPNCNCWRVE
jgi:hypothetical protein